MVFTADGQFLFVRVKSKIFTINFSLRLTVINLSIFKPTNLTMGLPLHRGKYGKPTKSRTSNCFVMLPCVPGETLRNSRSSVSRKAPWPKTMALTAIRNLQITTHPLCSYFRCILFLRQWSVLQSCNVCSTPPHWASSFTYVHAWLVWSTSVQ